jgi:tRNA(adenine34) deaminase
VPIGAVVAHRDGRVLAVGANRKHITGDPIDHAEMVALRTLTAGERDSTSIGAGGLNENATSGESDEPDADREAVAPADLVLVTTLEPCVMCLGAALELGIGHVVYGLEAPSNGAGSRVRDERRMPTLKGGVLRTECRALFERHGDARDQGSGAGGFVRTLLRLTR